MTREEILDALHSDGKLITKRCTEAYLKAQALWDSVLELVPEDFTTASDKIRYLKYGGGYCVVCGVRTKVDVSGRGFAKCCSKHRKPSDPPNRSKIIDKQLLYRLYIEEQKSLNEIAKLMGDISNVTLQKRLEEYAIPQRTHSEAQKLHAKPGVFKPRIRVDRSELRELYVEQKMPIEIISEKFKCHPETIRRFLIQEGIDRDRKGPSANEWKIRDILDKHGLKYTVNDRKVIKPLEIDFLLPEYNLGIETHGFNTHSLYKGGKGRSYHKTKYDMAKAVGIKLFQFWQSQLYNTPIVESMILNAVGQTPNKIYARKCSIIDVPRELGTSFCAANHLQGAPGNATRYRGLEFNSQLVSVIGIVSRPEGYTITRFCSLLFTNVVGAFQKLINTLPGTLVTYSDCAISDGALYEHAGFQLTNKNRNMFYTDYVNLLPRERFMKSKLPGLFGPIDDFHKKTENEIMYEHGYDVLHGAGTYTWKLIRR